MKTLHLLIIVTVGIVAVVSSFNNTVAQNATNSSNSVSDIPSAILHSSVPILSPSETQSLVNVALDIPELQNWSHNWQYVHTAFLGNDKAGTTGFEWQYAMVYLKTPPNSGLIPCDIGWEAEVTADMTTMKVVSADYPTMNSQCHGVGITGGGPRIISDITTTVSPLQQFKSGTPANDVKCNLGLWLVTKTEDGSPACVKPDTAYILIHHGWAKEVSQTSLYTILTIASTPCDTPYPQSNTGVAVLYMPANSTGKICATYHNPDSPTQSSASVFVARDVQQQASEITISAQPDIVPTGNSTIIYTIKTGSQAGFYGISFFCNSIPFAVGYDNQSRIILDDFPWLYKNDICLSQTNVFQITGLSGIHVKYVTQVHRG